MVVRHLLKKIDVGQQINYSYQTSDWPSVFPDIVDWDSTHVRNQGNMYVSGFQEIAGYKFGGITPKHAALVNPDYIEMIDTLTQGMSVTEWLYTDPGQGTVMNAESVRQKLGVDLKWDDTFLLNYSKLAGTKKMKKEFSFSSAAKWLPGLRYSDRKGEFRWCHFMMSIPTLFELGKGSRTDFNTMPIWKVMIRLNPDAKVSVEEVADKLKNYSKIFGFWLWSTVMADKKVAKIKLIFEIIINFVTTISLSLSLFSLVVTISSNLSESYKEIAILRCIGLENDKISRVYLWESIIVVLNGGVVGLCTGITVAGVILIQNSLWVELRPKFNFPWPLL